MISININLIKLYCFYIGTFIIKIIRLFLMNYQNKYLIYAISNLIIMSVYIYHVYIIRKIFL